MCTNGTAGKRHKWAVVFPAAGKMVQIEASREWARASVRSEALGLKRSVLLARAHQSRFLAAHHLVDAGLRILDALFGALLAVHYGVQVLANSNESAVFVKVNSLD